MKIIETREDGWTVAEGDFVLPQLSENEREEIKTRDWRGIKLEHRPNIIHLRHMWEYKKSPKVQAEILTFVKHLTGMELFSVVRSEQLEVNFHMQPRPDSEHWIVVDSKKRRYVIAGDWNQATFVLRGLVRQHRRGRKWTVGINGQAGTNAEQIAHFAEQKQIKFPTFEAVFQSMIAAVG